MSVEYPETIRKFEFLRDLYHIIPLIHVHNKLARCDTFSSLSLCDLVVKTLVAKIQRSWVQIPLRSKVNFSNFIYFKNFKRNYNLKKNLKLCSAFCGYMSSKSRWFLDTQKSTLVKF